MFMQFGTRTWNRTELQYLFLCCKIDLVGDLVGDLRGDLRGDLGDALTNSVVRCNPLLIFQRRVLDLSWTQGIIKIENTVMLCSKTILPFTA